MSTEKKRKIIRGILLVLWMILIFYFSHQNGDTSSDLSNTFTAQVIQVITRGGLDAEQLYWANAFTRKLAHLGIYTIGGILFANYLDIFLGKEEKLIIGATGAGVLYAITDEIHQYFVPGRSAAIIDVQIDTIGIFLGVMLFLTFKKWRQRKER